MLRGRAFGVLLVCACGPSVGDGPLDTTTSVETSELQSELCAAITGC